MARYKLRVLGRTVYETITDSSIPMTDYMTSGNSHDDPDPWDTVPFEPTYKLSPKSGQIPELARENATKIRDKVLRDGEIATDSAVVNGMKPLEGPQTRESAYYLTAGPLAATAEDIQWNTAFRFDPEEAPEFGSDDYFAAASELNIPDTPSMELVPKKVEKCYRELEKVTKQNDCDRVMHPWELRSIGPRLPDRAADRAFEYLAELPGVIPPEETGPAWERVDAEESATTADPGEVEG